MAPVRLAGTAHGIFGMVAALLALGHLFSVHVLGSRGHLRGDYSADLLLGLAILLPALMVAGSGWSLWAGQTRTLRAAFVSLALLVIADLAEVAGFIRASFPVWLLTACAVDGLLLCLVALSLRGEAVGAEAAPRLGPAVAGCLVPVASLAWFDLWGRAALAQLFLDMHSELNAPLAFLLEPTGWLLLAAPLALLGVGLATWRRPGLAQALLSAGALVGVGSVAMVFVVWRLPFTQT